MQDYPLKRTDGDRLSFIEVIIGESDEDATLADAAVANDCNLEEMIVIFCRHLVWTVIIE